MYKGRMQVSFSSITLWNKLKFWNSQWHSISCIHIRIYVYTDKWCGSYGTVTRFKSLISLQQWKTWMKYGYQ